MHLYLNPATLYLGWCPHKAGTETSQNLVFVFSGCFPSPGPGERGHRGRGVFSVKAAVAVFGMPSKSERETNTQGMVTDSDALTAEEESRPGEEGELIVRDLSLCRENKRF